MIYVDFESILVPEDNGKQNPNEFYMSQYQKHITCSYSYKLVRVDDKFSKPFKSNLGKDAVYNFINSMIEESKYCSGVMEKNFDKELKMTKTDNEDFNKSAKGWICGNTSVNGDLKVRDHCHITGKFRSSAHRDCNVNVKLNHKVSNVSHNLKIYDS